MAFSETTCPPVCAGCFSLPEARTFEAFVSCGLCLLKLGYIRKHALREMTQRVSWLVWPRELVQTDVEVVSCGWTPQIQKWLETFVSFGLRVFRLGRKGEYRSVRWSLWLFRTEIESKMTREVVSCGHI